MRNFKSDAKYIDFGNFWIQEIETNLKSLTFREFSFPNIPWNDKYILVRWDHIVRGESSDFLSRRNRGFWNPLFIRLKLFKKGDLIMPVGFAKDGNRKYEIEINGKESYGLLPINNPYIFNENDKDKFISFSSSIGPYLKFLNFNTIPYEEKPQILDAIDTRCAFAIHLLLKGSVEHHNHFFMVDRLIDCTIALESLYLYSEKKKGETLSLRISVLLGKDEEDTKEIFDLVSRFYRIRSDIIHGSLMKNGDREYLESNFPNYENYLRKSILAFLDLNTNNKSKSNVIKAINNASKDANNKTELQKSLKLLQQAE